MEIESVCINYCYSDFSNLSSSKDIREHYSCQYRNMTCINDKCNIICDTYHGCSNAVINSSNSELTITCTKREACINLS